MHDLLSVLRHPAPGVAPALLGSVLTHRIEGSAVSVRITEVEAYLGAHDPGSHAFRGRTNRNATMFGPAGRLYVYFTYGMHYCANVVCGTEGTATGLLLRAGEVTAGIEAARTRRGSPRADRDLARGPARLTQALGIDLSQNGAVLGAPDEESELSLVLPAAPAPPSSISSGPRVGVSGEGGTNKYPWRFWLTGEPTVSVYRPAVPRKRPRSTPAAP